ncbi:phosphatidate cytidylyltransferase [Nitratifractor sp.]
MGTSNKSRTRWQTAAVLLGAIALVGIVDVPWLTWLFLGLVYAGAHLEAERLFGVASMAVRAAAAGLWILAPWVPHPGDWIFVALLGGAGYLAYRRDFDPRNLLPLVYPGAGMIYLWTLYHDHGMRALVWILVIVALTDVGAYYAGRQFGKHPFSPTSPKKTLEGVYGGVAIGTLGGFLLMADTGTIGASALIVAAIVSYVAVFGDLFESFLKRRAGVKDSGDILPGHGGILDRIDGYLFAAPVLYVLLQLTGS